MKKEVYVKPEVKSEIMEAEVLNTQWGSPVGGSGDGDGCGGGGCP
jgi:hypothetical protein